MQVFQSEVDSLTGVPEAISDLLRGEERIVRIPELLDNMLVCKMVGLCH